MGLVLRVLEARGLATVQLGVVRSAMDQSPAPRNVFVRFRLGQAFGEPGHAAQHAAVFSSLVDAVSGITTPGACVTLPYRWKRETYA